LARSQAAQALAWRGRTEMLHNLTRNRLDTLVADFEVVGHLRDWSLALAWETSPINYSVRYPATFQGQRYSEKNGDLHQGVSLESHRYRRETW
jgi:hypothetical protein